MRPAGVLLRRGETVTDTGERHVTTEAETGVGCLYPGDAHDFPAEQKQEEGVGWPVPQITQRESKAPRFQTASLRISVVLNHLVCDHLSWYGCPRGLTR